MEDDQEEEEDEEQEEEVLSGGTEPGAKSKSPREKPKCEGNGNKKRKRKKIPGLGSQHGPLIMPKDDKQDKILKILLANRDKAQKALDIEAT